MTAFGKLNDNNKYRNSDTCAILLASSSVKVWISFANQTSDYKMRTKHNQTMASKWG